jgi:predicted transcriptional regulator
MEIPLSPETESCLKRLAEDAGRDADQFAAELLQRFAQQDSAFRAAVQRGIEDADRGDLIDEDAMDARVASWFAA